MPSFPVLPESEGFLLSGSALVFPLPQPFRDPFSRNIPKDQIHEN